MKKIKVIAKRADKAEPYVTYLSNDLKALQTFVGGYIETVTICTDLVILCNEEGCIKKLPVNCNVLGQYFFGDIAFIGVDGEEFADCPASLETIKSIIREVRKMVRGRGKHNKEIPAAKLGLATWCPRTDCFACKGEACTALRNTDFGDKPCPFFKSRARYIEELKLVEEVNARHRVQYKVAMMSELGTPGTPKKKRAKHSDESNNE